MLRDSVIVVTGSAGRLGSRLVRRLGEDGAKLAAVVRTEEEARDFGFSDGVGGEAFAIDFEDEGQVRSGFEQIHSRFNRIDAVLHTVGGWEAHPTADMSLDDWQRILDVNLNSTFLCFREALRLMDGPGRLIAFASRQGADAGLAEQAAYAAAKAGVIRLVESITAEYGNRGITAHAVAPSLILYEDGSGGVHVDDLVTLCRTLVEPAGRAVAGATIRAYGDAW